MDLVDMRRLPFNITTLTDPSLETFILSTTAGLQISLKSIAFIIETNLPFLSASWAVELSLVFADVVFMLFLTN